MIWNDKLDRILEKLLEKIHKLFKINNFELLYVLKHLFKYSQPDFTKVNTYQVRKCYDVMIDIFNHFEKDLKDIIKSYLIRELIDSLKRFRNGYKLYLDNVKEYRELGLVYPKNHFIGKEKNTLRNGLRYRDRISQLTKLNECTEVISFDIETYEGICKLLSRSENLEGNGTKPYILNPSFDDCLKFLCYHRNNSRCYRFFFNIDFDITAILKLLPQTEKNLIFIDRLSRGIEVIYKNYKLKWLRTKFFSIKILNCKKSVFITDIYTFFNLSLNESSEKYLNKHKVKDVDAERLNHDKQYWKDNLKDIIRYCIVDCNLTRDLGWLLIKSIKKLKLPLPKYLVSPASISKQYYRQNNFIPSLRNTPISIIQIAYNCYFGGRFEVLKRGYFDKLFLLDINSQYPTFIKDLPDMYNGYWRVYKNPKKLPKDKCIGYFEVLLDIPSNLKISTLPMKYKGIVIFPNGKFWVKATWFDLDMLRDYIVKIRKAWVYEPLSNNLYPFREKTLKLFEMKKEYKSNPLKMLYETIKITLNGIYGCTWEQHENIYLDEKENEIKELKGGVLFNPIYASQITAFGRWSVLKDVPKEYYKNIIAIHTDSLITDLKFNFLDYGKELGQWNDESKELENKDSIIIGTGIYQIGYKNYKKDEKGNLIYKTDMYGNFKLDDKGKKQKISIDIVKTRGIPFKFIKNYFDFCKENKNLSSKEFIIKRMKKVRQALIQDKHIFNTNIMNDNPRTLESNSDVKRDWYDDFKDFNDVLSRNIDSLPYYSFKRSSEIFPNPLLLQKDIGCSFREAKRLIKQINKE